MRFQYIASQANGKIVEDEFEAAGPAEILEYLAGQGLRPISIKTTKGLGEVGKNFIFGGGINISDKVFLTKYLSLMLKVGTNLFAAINILIADLDKPSMKALLIEIRSALEKGKPFFTVFLKYPKYFSAVFVNLIKAGESSGNLDTVFENLSTSLEKEQDLRRSVRAALIYPIILLGASFGLLLLLVVFAIPRLAKVFSTFSAKPPAFSQIVINVGLFINDYVVVILLLLVFASVGGWFFFGKTISGKKVAYRFYTKLPVIKNVLKQTALQRFASTLSSLLKAGLPILDAMEITAQTVGSEPMKEALIRISRDGISKGLTLGEAFRREPIFPKIVVNLIAISEKAGHIENILAILADFYAGEVEVAVKSMVGFLEPIMLLGIGLVIGTIAVAVIVPIYQMVGQF
ncbi:MAG: type II secretion system F family protein [Candidatus Paceibacterota bacterium]